MARNMGVWEGRDREAAQERTSPSSPPALGGGGDSKARLHGPGTGVPNLPEATSELCESRWSLGITSPPSSLVSSHSPFFGEDDSGFFLRAIGQDAAHRLAANPRPGHLYFLHFPVEETEALLSPGRGVGVEHPRRTPRASKKPPTLSEACLPLLGQIRPLTPEIPQGSQTESQLRASAALLRDMSLHYLCDCLFPVCLPAGLCAGIVSTVFPLSSVPRIQ